MEPNRTLRSVPNVEIIGMEEPAWGVIAPMVRTDSFETFWSGHRNPLCRALALTLGDADLATEAIDEAMARAFQRWPHVSQLDSPGGWVYRVGFNWSRSLRRRALRRPPHWMLASTAAANDRFEPTIDAALAGLPITQRSVVVCRLLLGLSEAQTADALRVRPGTVKSRLSRAIDDLTISLAHLNPKLETKEDQP